MEIIKKIIKKIKKEFAVFSLMTCGFSRAASNKWYWDTQRDIKLHKDEYSRNIIKYWHRRGYLCSSIKRWELVDKRDNNFFSDFEYVCLFPLNNSFGKWLSDMLTTQRVMHPDGEHFRNVYFSIVKREDSQLILRVGHEDRCYSTKDVLKLINEMGVVELCPAFWNSKGKRYSLSSVYNEEKDEFEYCCNDEVTDAEQIDQIITELKRNYVIADPVPICKDYGDRKLDCYLTVWIANDIGEKAQILAAEMNIFSESNDSDKANISVTLVNLNDGTFVYQEEVFKIPNWIVLKDELCNDAMRIPQISFFSASVALGSDNSFTYLRFSNRPQLPQGKFSEDFDLYLRKRYNNQFQKKSLGEQVNDITKKMRSNLRKRISRSGMRAYMYGLWRSAALDDLIHTKGVSLSKKIWAHKNGFLSFRIYQYGITRENYHQFLSDYDYYWLNRINNHYQIWVNDKTTYRYIMEPFKQFVPQYYFSVFKRNGNTIIKKMCDCPADVQDGFAGLLEMLFRKGKLAFKASGGTHGDGFYCLSYDDGLILANGKQCGETGLRQLIDETKAFYVVTEYLDMHKDLKKIYDKSVNTVRMMVVNDHGFDPRILQTYMRIGSSKTGYTDNVGYGGICAFVNTETGELYQPECLVNHRYIPCLNHPDTNKPIAGILPNWQFTKNKILDICRYLCELEYLGFDVALTDDGFQILEINIHQDLHKVATFNSEINEFFQRKIEYKKKKFNI